MQSHPPLEGLAPGSPARGERRPLDLSGPVPAVLALIGCALFAVSIPPVPDHGYQFYLATQLLDGARLYVDVGAADQHPPLVTWLAAAFVALGRATGVSAMLLHSLAVSCTVAASIYCVWRLARLSGFMVAVLVLALMALAGPYFGQGEHLALVLALPYLASAAAVRDGRQLSRRASILIAIVAALGLAMKPYFALVWVGVELYIAQGRGARSLLRAESLAIFLVFLLYVIATAVFTPDFFKLVPAVLNLYPHFAHVSLRSMLFDRRTLLLVVALAAARTMQQDDGAKHLADIISIAALAMFSAVLMQGKGWGYHWYPVNALAVVLCGLATAPHVSRYARIAVPALAVAAVVVMNLQVQRTERLLVQAPSFLPGMMRATERYAKGGSIIALSHTLNVAFPLVNLSGARWGLPYGHLWMIPAIYEDAWEGRAPFHYRVAGKWQGLEQQMFDRVWTSIERIDPAIIIVPLPFANGFNMRQYFETDPRFRDRFRRSPVLDTVGYYLVIGRPAGAP
jgi:hypothetical protein